MFTDNEYTKLQTFRNNHGYRLRLETDEEILAKAEAVYDDVYIRSRLHTLDSGIFGATTVNPQCSICYQHSDKCPGHFAVIQLPFPIPRTICLKEFKALIQLICPICSHFVIKQPERALRLHPDSRMLWIKSETEKLIKPDSNIIECPVCRNKISLLRVAQDEPAIRVFIELPQNGVLEQVNPSHLHQMLLNFSEVEIAGFSEMDHPKNFMTTLIPIIPGKLRPKTMMSSESVLTSYYKVIIEEICPELKRVFKHIALGNHVVIIERGNQAKSFNDNYDRLMAYYLLITDPGTDRTREMALNLINKRDRKHVDIYNTLLGRMKGKDRSIFNKGIVASRHNISARTVLGGAADAKIKTLSVPYHIANKLYTMYPVYEQNLKAMRQLVASMNNVKTLTSVYTPRVVAIYNCATNVTTKVSYKDALNKASSLKPGDRIGISLLSTDLVMQDRFPIVREESWSTFQVRKEDNTIVTIPLSVCEKEMADFDGDEAQICVPYAHYTDAEGLLLHSQATQYIAYKDGNPAIWFPWTGDAAYGLEKFTIGRKCNIYNGKYVEEYNVCDKINSYLPKDLTYVDKTLSIVNGVLNGKEGEYTAECKTKFMNKEFWKYYSTLYGADKAEDLMDKLIQLAYDVNIDQGCSLGYEIFIYGDDTKKKVKEILDETLENMTKIEMSNEKHKDVKQIMASEGQKAKIKKILVDAAKGTSLDKMGYTTQRQEEYYQTVVSTDHIKADGTRIQPILAENTRTCAAFPHDSIDPRAYGYTGYSYSNDYPPICHFYECKEQRYALFQKGQGVAKQGYLSKRVGAANGVGYADFNSGLVTNYQQISLVYGACGLDPRMFVKQPLIDINLTEAEFKKKYSDKELIKLYKHIHEANNRYSIFTCFVKAEQIKPEFVAGFNYDMMLSNSKGKVLTQKEIDEFINKLKDIFVPEGCAQKYSLENLICHEYYFRVKLSQQETNQETLDKILQIFSNTLVNGGDPVGMKASLAISEPLTQAVLHAIHHASGGGASEEQIERSAGITRFEEIIAGNKPKNTVITLKLLDDSKQATLDYANEQETFYFNDIWTRMELSISDRVSNKIIDLHPNINIKDVDVNPYYITSIWQLNKISAYHIHVVDVINELKKNFPEIMFITGYVLNSSEFMSYIYFKPTVSANDIQVIMETWDQQKASTVVHGKYLKNCYVSENKNNPGHYIIEANEVNANSMSLQNLILDPRIDPAGCRTTDTVVTQKLFGVFETAARVHEELIFTATNLSDTSGVLHRHYKTIADTMYLSGDAQYASRNSLRRDETMDTIRLVQFETPKDMIQQSLKHGNIQPIADPYSASMFGELPSLGTGVSKIIMYPVN